MNVVQACYWSSMRTFALAFLFACSTSAAAYEPDAARSDSYLTPDAAPAPQNHGCHMGLLPAARTKTYVDGDPVDPAILNELQDNIVSTKRKSFSRPRAPRFVLQGSWAVPSLVTDSLGKTLVASVSTAGSVAGYIEIPFDDGDRITGLALQVCGNASADTVFDVFLGTTAAGLVSIASGGITDTNRTNTWATLSTLVITPTILTAGNTLYLQAIPNAASYNLAAVIPTFDRL